jgi:hypothetical protein
MSEILPNKRKTILDESNWETVKSGLLSRSRQKGKGVLFLPHSRFERESA